MAFSRKSTHCCLLLLVLMVQLTSSFSVEELCNRRCLYGRGGVLCNCNARHFTGKRSSLPDDDNVYITGFNSHVRHSKFPHEDIRREKTANTLGVDSLSGNGIHHHDYNLPKGNHFDEAWYRQQFEEILNSINQKGISNTAKIDAENRDDTDKEGDKSNIHTKDDSVLPILYIEQINNSDDDVTPTKDEASSKVKQIVTGPYLKIGQHDASNHLHGDEEVDNDEEIAPNNDMQRHHLFQLQRFLSRALHGR